MRFIGLFFAIDHEREYGDGDMCVVGVFSVVCSHTGQDSKDSRLDCL